MTDAYDMEEVYDQVRSILGEHFHSFCFIVSDEDGDLFYDYTNHMIGKMLMSAAQEDLNSDLGELEILWSQEGDYFEEDLESDGIE